MMVRFLVILFCLQVELSSAFSPTLSMQCRPHIHIRSRNSRLGATSTESGSAIRISRACNFIAMSPKFMHEPVDDFDVDVGKTRPSCCEAKTKEASAFAKMDHFTSKHCLEPQFPGICFIFFNPCFFLFGPFLLIILFLGITLCFLIFTQLFLISIALIVWFLAAAGVRLP
jgi:hypothetical protein